MNKKEYLILFGTGVSGITVGLDLTIVNASLANIQRELQSNISQLQWIMAGFGVFFCAFLVVMGRFGDLYGRKKFLLGSLVGFGLASLGAGLSNSSLELILMRMLQGFFGSSILPCGTALIANEFEKEHQGRALGIYGSLVGVGICLGPIVGGIIEKSLNWRWIFFINVPIIAFSLILCAIVLHESKLVTSKKVAWIDAIILAVFLGSLTFVISEGEFYGWKSPLILSITMLSMISSIMLYYLEKNAENPVIPILLFKNSGFLLAVLIYAGAVAFHWPVLFLMPIYLSNIVGYDSFIASVLLASMTLMTIISPVIAGYFYDKNNKVLSIHAIFILNIVSLIMFLFLSINGPMVLILISFVLFGVAWGIGNGIATPIALFKTNNSEHAGLISGALTTVLNIFAIFSLAISTTIFQINEKHYFVESIQNLPVNYIRQIEPRPTLDIYNDLMLAVPESGCKCILGYKVD